MDRPGGALSLAVAVAAVVLAIGLMLVLQPDAGPPVDPGAAVEAPRSDPATVQSPYSTPAAPRPYEIRPDGTIGPVPFREAAPAPRVPKDYVFTSDARGVTSAALSRREDIVTCVTSYWSRSGGERGFGGRFTLEIAVEPEGDGTVVSTNVMNGPPDDALDDCVSAAMADAKFEQPPHRVVVRWPVPLPDDE
jgi:outer membrane biosynthesis protein TonB